MRNIGLAAFCATTCVLVPAALHTLTASSKPLNKLAAPDQQALILDGVRIDASLDKAIVDPGDKVRVKLKATGAKNQKVTVDVLVLESTGTGGGRVESPPNKVALEQISLIANGPARELSYQLRGYRGMEMEGTSPFGRYTVLVMRPRDAKKLDKLRRKRSNLDDMGYNEAFYEMYSNLGQSEKPTQDADSEADEDVGLPGTSARLDVITRPNDSSVAIVAPQSARVGEPFTVTVRVKNTSDKSIEKMKVELSRPEMLYDLTYKGLDEEHVTYAEPKEIALESGATAEVKFEVTADQAGVAGLYAHTFTDEDFQLGDVALDAIEVVAKDTAPAVVSKR